MSLEQLEALLSQAQLDSALREKLQNAPSKESVLAIAQSAGFEISMADFAEAEEEINASSQSDKLIWIEGSTSPKNISSGQTYSNKDNIQVGSFGVQELLIIRGCLKIMEKSRMLMRRRMRKIGSRQCHLASSIR